MQPQIPLTRDLVLIGGGHTHALVLRKWAMNPLPGVRLTLINPTPYAAYSGMLPGHIAGHYDRSELNIDLVRLARYAGARLVLGRARGIDRVNRRVIVPGRPDIAYDIASIDIGVTSEMPALPGFAEYAVPAKPLDDFADAWAAWVAKVSDGSAEPRMVVVGGGVAGVELALAARNRIGSEADIAVIESDVALSAVGSGAAKALCRHLNAERIALIEGAAATTIEPDGVRLSNGRKVRAAFVIGTAASRSQGWLGDTGLALHNGFVSIEPTLRSITDPQIFAVGDIADMGYSPRPKAGVFAVRQAPVLLHNLKVALSESGTMKPYNPQRDYLKLISTGGKGAVADKWGLPLDGAWLWRWKDRIDRKFMAQFHDLPAMPQPTLPAVTAAGLREELGRGKPLCGGCGAKVGQADLKNALSFLPGPMRPDVQSGAGDDAAILSHGKGHQVLTTDHVRAFTEDPWLLSKITAIHALGDIWSMGARPQAALVQVILPRMSPRLQSETLREILAAASETFGAEGADIVGGHTSLGAELTVGFTITGLSANPPITQSGAKAGDWLIVTKPIGTGVILAAEMALAAPGSVVAKALRSMALPQGNAARLLVPYAHAMTDVTGFGLAGHLMGMLEASSVAARISLSSVPVLPGAEALSAAGHASTILPANRSAVGRMLMTESARTELLFDPQTSGGMLAAVPAGEAIGLVKRLRSTGHHAAIIGEVLEGEPFLTVED